ncbi:restriction endonuclease subunit S [Endozoicomonas montiporae]|uniref:Type I site-specific deoxyribonuclease specificity subunit n=1 Tax=Endozoicomonas montiporae CL-33 TaxID=570277 RepID=A0A142BI62_9GAMM|nr:restriction endonuclease subunit S [Endozoicomonas montiporae]AMO58438.1 type I site-specific deoxyribonuclease specificity subunit [Endozoicomonas montiporae CL-33]
MNRVVSESRYNAYPEYKESGVDDFPQIPLHWVVGRVKFVTDNLDKFRIPLSSEERGKRQGKYPYYGASGVIDYVDDYIFEGETILYGEDGANLLARSTPLAFLADGKYWVNNHAHILKAKDRINRYWARSLNNIDIAPLVSGSAQPKLTAEALGNLPVVYPPTESERIKITNFLDHETAKIDTLIEEQQSLIRLLKEKRQALISHAVTKGLNPNAPMKDSGVEWLGEVPEHWRVTKLGQLAFMQEGPGLRTWQFKDDGTRVICVTNITEDGINFSKLEKFISTDEYKESYQHFTVNKGDILLSSSGNSWGKVATYEGSEKVILNTSTIRLNELQHKPLVLDYIQLFLQSEACREQLGVAMTGSCQPNFGPTHLKEAKTPIPPEDEQVEISRFIAAQKQQFNQPIEACEQAVEFMQERRTALISAAVTGKIDVRDWQPAKQKEHPAEATA